MSYDNRKSFLDEKYEASSSPNFEDMTSQNFPRNKGMNHQIQVFTPEKGFKFEKNEFYVQNRYSRSKVDPPPCQLQQF